VTKDLQYAGQSRLFPKLQLTDPTCTLDSLALVQVGPLALQILVDLGKSALLLHSFLQYLIHSSSFLVE
jgi:hypothetical protein